MTVLLLPMTAMASPPAPPLLLVPLAPPPSPPLTVILPALVVPLLEMAALSACLAGIRSPWGTFGSGLLLPLPLPAPSLIHLVEGRLVFTWLGLFLCPLSP